MTTETTLTITETVKSDTPATTDKSALHSTTTELTAKLADMMSIDPKTGIITVVQDAYERLLPTDISIDTVKRLRQHESHLYAAAFNAVGDLSRETAAAHPGLDRTQAELNLIGRDRFDITWNRQVERNAGIPKDGQPAEKKTVYGTMTGALRVSGADAARGEMNKVATRQKAAALEMFGAK